MSEDEKRISMNKGYTEKGFAKKSISFTYKISRRQ